MGEGARRVMEAGFDGVMIHGANDTSPANYCPAGLTREPMRMG